MHGLEQILGLFIAGLVLAGTARHFVAHSPVFLALGGAVLAFVPGAQSFTVPPELVLAIFVARTLRRVERPAQQG
jgi:CPA1 family monovalent cation:H+ antiporter